MATSSKYDVGLDADGDLPVVCRHITDLDLVVQRVTRRLQTFLGEWIGDRRVGLPYFAWAAQKPPRVDSIGATVRREIESTPGVTRVAGWTGAFNTTTRTLTYSGTIYTRFGGVGATVQVFGSPQSGNRNAVFSILLTPAHLVGR